MRKTPLRKAVPPWSVPAKCWRVFCWPQRHNRRKDEALGSTTTKISAIVPSRAWVAILYEPSKDFNIWQVHGRPHQTKTTTQQTVMCTSTARCRKRTSTRCGTAKRRTTANPLSRTRTRKTKRRNDVGTSFDGMETDNMWSEVLQYALRHDKHEPTIETIESRAQATDEASANAQDMRTRYTKAMMSIGCPDGVLRTRPRTGGFMGHPVVCKAFGHTFQRPVAE